MPFEKRGSLKDELLEWVGLKEAWLPVRGPNDPINILFMSCSESTSVIDVVSSSEGGSGGSPDTVDKLNHGMLSWTEVDISLQMVAKYCNNDMPFT